MDKKYGIEYLIRAFDKVYNNIEKIDSRLANLMYLELVGSGNQMEELKVLSEKLGINNRVRFIGRVPHDKVPDYLSRFDIYVAPSILDSESFGVAVIEASACKRPVIVSDVGGLPEVVQDGVIGYIVSPKDVDALAEKIQTLLLNSEKRRSMGEAGESFVRNVYEWQHCVDIMETVYNSIIEKKYTTIFVER